MGQDELQAALAGIRARLDAELESQWHVVEQKHAEALEQLRQTVEADAEQRWTATLHEVESRWASRLESELIERSTKAEQKIAAEAARVRAEAEHVEREALARAREEFAGTLAAERQRAKADLDAAVIEARAAERQAQLAAMARLLDAIRAISGARSLSDALTALASGASAAASRAIVLIVNGDLLQPWKTEGFPRVPTELSLSDGTVLGAAIHTGQPASTAAAAAPRFAELGADRAGLAVPLTVGGHSVAVLYADDGAAEQSEAPASWPEAVQILGGHASACLAELTAIRTAQALRVSSAPVAVASNEPDSTALDADTQARRYARLLVSGIKRYNESAVRLGREKRDLLDRLRPEIERARTLYEERVPSSVSDRGSYFQQELVQTLAGGNPALLGASL
jgi:hypothetical protein